MKFKFNRDLLIISLVILIIYCSFFFWHVSKLEALPSPLYGGDYYYSHGQIQHVLSGGNPLVSSTFLGSTPAYLPFYPILVAIFSVITGTTAFGAMLGSSFIFLILSLFFCYKVANQFISNKIVAAASLILFLPLKGFPIFKYLNFAMFVMTPLFFWLAIKFYRNTTKKNAILLGIVYGLMGITHSIGFIYSTIFLIFLAIEMLVLQYSKFRPYKFEKKKFKKTGLETFKKFAIVAMIGIAIAMLFWFKPIFVHGGQSVNPVIEFSQPDYTRGDIQWENLSGFIKGIFSFNSVFSVLALLGIVGIFLMKKGWQKRMLILMLIFFVLTRIHPIFTIPLLGIHFSPNYMNSFSYRILVPIFALVPLAILLNQKFKQSAKYLVIGILLLGALWTNFDSGQDFVLNNKWEQAGQRPMFADFGVMSKWVLENTDVNDVFLSNNELGFALNSLTGRKLVYFKRGHIDSFTNAEQRGMDLAIMLYGNDDDKREELLQEYDVKYLYWSSDWLGKEWVQQGDKIVPGFDPLLLRAKPEILAAYDKYNITYFTGNHWIDSSIIGEKYRKYDVVTVVPYSWDNEKPWHPDLSARMELLWEHTTPQFSQKIFAVK